MNLIRKSAKLIQIMTGNHLLILCSALLLSACSGAGSGSLDSILVVPSTATGSTSAGSSSSTATPTPTPAVGGTSSLMVVSGDSQLVPINTQASASLLVMAKNGTNQPLANTAITFGVSGGGSVSSTTVTTDANGLAAVDFTAGGVAGISTVTATSSVGTTSFVLTVTALTSYTIQIVSGDAQSAGVGSTLSASPLLVRVLDGNGTPARFLSLTYAVQSGNGFFSGASSKTVLTDTNGYAQATYTLGTTVGTNSIRVSISSASGIYASFTETGTVASGATVDLTQSTISLSQTTVTANGANLVTVTVSVRDTNGNLIPSSTKVVSTTISPSVGSWVSSSTFTYTSTGTYTNTYQVGTNPGTVGFSATIGGSSILSGSASLTLTSGGNSLVVIGGDLQQVPINSQASSSLIVMAKDGANQPISGKTVTFSIASGGTLSATTATTDSNGLASVDFTAGGTSGSASITATSSVGTVTFTETIVALTSYTLQVVAGDSQTGAVGSTLSATPLKVLVLNGSGAPAANVSVTYSVQSGNGSFAGASSKVVTSDSSGFAQATFTLGTISGTNTIRAAISSASAVYTSFSETGTVTSGATVDLAQSSISLSQSSVNANGVNTVTVTVHVKDASGNLIPNNALAVVGSFSPSTGSWVSSSAFAYTSTGTYTNTYQVGTTSGTVVFSATIAGSAIASGSASLTLVNAGNSLVIVSGDLQQVPVNTQASSPLTVMAKDGANQPIAGKVITFSVINGGTISATTATTDSNGLASIDFTATGTVATANVSATSSVGTVTFTETVIALSAFTLQNIAGDAQTGIVGSTLSATPLKVLVLNGSGAPAPNVSVTYSVQSGNGSFAGASSKVVTSDSSGYAQATFTLGSTSGTNTVRAAISSAPAVYSSFSETGTVSSGATVDLAQSTISLSQSSVNANGVSTVTVTVLVKDSSGNLIPNSSLAIVGSFTPSNGSWVTSSSFVNTSAGTYTNTYKVSTTSGTVAFSATIAGSAITSGSASLTLVNAGNSLVVVSGDLQQVPINGQAASSLIVMAKDGANQPISGKTVTFSIASGGTLSATTATTDSNGLAAVDFTAGGTAGSASITATSSVGTVTFTETIVALTSYTLQIIAGDAQTGSVGTSLSGVPLKVLVLNNSGAPATNVSVTYSVQSGNGNFSGASSRVVTSDTSGYAQATFTLGSTSGTNTVRATITAASSVFTTFTETGTVPSNSTVDLTNSIISLSQSSSQANNTNLITVTILVKDSYGNLIPNAAQTIATSFAPANGSWATTSTFSYSSTGTYTNTYKVGTTAGTVVFTGSIGGSNLLSGTASLLLNTGNITNAGGATLTVVSGNAQTTQIAQAVSSPLKIIALDSLGIPISGSSITFTVTSGGGTFSGSNSTVVTTGADGMAQATYSGGATSGAVVVTASSLQGTAVFAVTVQDLTGYVITKVSGDTQSAYLNTALTTMTSHVSKADGSAAVGIALRFQCQSVNCGLFSNGLNSIDTTTDSSGNASAVYTLGTSPGSYTVRAIIPAQATIYTDFGATATVNPASAISLANSTLALSASSVSATGSDSVVVTVTLKDQYGNIIPSTNSTVTVSPSPSNLGAWMGGGFVAGTAGVYTRTYSVGTATGSIVFTASAGGSALTSGTATLTVNANSTPDLTKVTITALNASLTADGASTTTIVVTLYDQYNNQISGSGYTVVASANTGTLTGSSMSYHSPTGTYRQVYTVPSTTGTGTATITLSTVNGSAVTGKTTAITLATSSYSSTASTITIPSRVYATMASAQTITMTLKDANGNPIIVSSPTITLSKTTVTGTFTGSPSFSAVTSQGNGVYTATLTSPTTCSSAPCVQSISATVTHASINSGVATAIGSAFNVQYTTAAVTPAAAQSTVTLSSTSGVSGAGASTITLTITLKTSASAAVNVGGDKANLAITNSFGSTVSSITDNDNGTYTAVVYSPVSPVSGTINVKYGGTDISGSPASVTFYGPISLSNSVLAISANTLSGAGSVQVTLTAKDAQGNFIPSTTPTGISQIKFLVSNSAGGTTVSGANTPTASSTALVGGNATYYQTITRAGSPTIGFETATISAQYSSDGGSTWNTFTSVVSLSITPINLAGVTINCSNIATYRDTNIYVSGGVLTIDSWKDGAYYTTGSCAGYGAAHPFRFATVTVDAGGSIKHAATTTSDTYGLDIEVTGALTVNTGGNIDANGLGCVQPASQGYGYTPDPTTNIPTQTGGASGNPGLSGTAGSYANRQTGNAAYGSASDPNAVGSSGYANSNGLTLYTAGGLIRIKAASIVNNGVIRANTPSSATNTAQNGPASGGGIKLTITGTTLTGNGSITAIGGTNSSGTLISSGGRIAILGNATSFTGTISAAGGTVGSYDGTLYFDTTPPFTNIPHSIDLSSATTYNQSTLPNFISSSSNIVVGSGYTFALDNTSRTIASLTSSGTLVTGTGTLTITNAASSTTMTANGPLVVGGALTATTLTANGTLSVGGALTTSTLTAGSTIDVTGNFTSGTLTTSSAVTVGGNLSTSGTMTLGGGAVSVTGSFTQTGGSITHSNPTIANSSTFPRVDITAANITVTSISATGKGLLGAISSGVTGCTGNGGVAWTYTSSSNFTIICSAIGVSNKGGNHYTAGNGNTATTWGVPNYPYTYGGGGAGAWSSGASGASSGGGIIRLITAGTLDVKGSVDASGGNSAVQTYSGSGAGGSIYINAGVLTSSNNLGTIVSTGGSVASATTGTGGAGGMVRIYTTSGTHTGSISTSVAGGVSAAGNGAAGNITESTCASPNSTSGYCTAY